MPDNEFLHGHVRKLSMTVLLNENYEGGEFQFATYDKEECVIHIPEFNKIGSIVVFASDVEHRVAPVTTGIRYSLVTWFLGPPFK
jgi:PKHD-type hydroxylase